MVEPSASLQDQLEEGGHILRLIANTDKTAKARQTFDYLTNRLKFLDEYWQSFKTRHGTVCRENKSLQSAHEYFTELKYYEYEDPFLEAKTELTAMLVAVAPVSTQTVTASGGASIQLLPQQEKLAPLPLPKLNGVQRGWESFKEVFCASVVDVPSMPKTHKMQRLLSCLEGPAAARLAGMSGTSCNFDAAWSILLATYDNKRIRLSGHLQRILSMPTAKETAADIFVLLDTVEEAVRTLTAMQRPVDKWDDWLVHLVETRLDPVTWKDWEKSIEGKDFPEYSLLKTFLEARCRSLTTATASDDCFSKVSEKSAGAVKKQPSKSHLTHTVQVQRPPQLSLTQHTASSQVVDDRAARNKLSCPLCQGKHFIAYCPTFVNADNAKRWSQMKKSGLCFNCLRPSHGSGECPSSQRCKVDSCNAPHHSFLHSDRGSKPASSTSSPANTQSLSHHAQVTIQKTTLLATARVVLIAANGETMLIRALLDHGSEVSFVSERVVQALRLAKRRSCTRISGVGGDVGARTVGEVDLTVTSAATGTFKLHLTALVLPRITSSLPGRLVEHVEWAHVAGLELADPKYNVPGRVDCLLGADVYSLLLLDGVKKGEPTDPVTQNTVLGWVLTGPTTAAGTCPTFSQCHVVRCHHAATSCCQLRDELRRFWEVEELADKPHVSAEDQECEAHFARTHSRDQTGRYVLRLPLSKTADFPGSLKIAKSRFLGGEKRCQRKPEERQAYVNFMREYQDLGHMEKVPVDEVDSPASYYIPHHAIFKGDGSGKIRVVFNASQAAENGCSLNDALHAGAKLQTDTPVIVTRWRFFRFVFSADIVKMFRQFRIHAADTDWLRVVWRDSLEEAIHHFRLTTVTYGTACAPIQAIRTLHQLAEYTHVYAYVRRWLSVHRQPGTRTGVGLAAEEIRSALLFVIKETQAEFFPRELRNLRRAEPLSRRSPIRRCLPFIDEHGIIRVGGRLQNFALSYEEKHPAIIPLDSHLATLIIREAHGRTLHGDPQLVLSHIRRRFWIPRVRNKVRRLVRLCVRCVRFQGRVEEQQMAPLPAARGQQASPFSTCGVDFAGPFPVRTSKGRGQKSSKGYVCLFVCLSTRAVNLEVVSDLSAQMFLAAFRRFIGRRGLCHTVYSDNGTNFQGARAELRRLFDHASSFSKEVADELARVEIAWRFIPPRAPHFGGHWEAGVKSFKHHLKRVLGDATLMFEEFSTLGVQIEACLNSRPISPLSNNPEDVASLTPGHFLIGRTLTALPEPSDFPARLAGCRATNCPR